ncbi:transporter substrate-binding domain-containing protein [Tropicibacter naphthalenivorans]|uniref:Cystine transporter subunit n=1 Tax=Tropicibacter naphthalenivorans TaxID=441103 RepID=A0A0P1GTF4_9RHOB|nr:transporter substrate-binding domain-containing protein [Tropicibacter naphthalenivorans]CUH77344.1 cystine transporter subunit [Tropicibacter naphthalenivorans]SMC58832.1 amino acid ABC transporter substrate-binding protein, PAAT family [Tropicibacter naphthalenivorans]
MNGMVNYFRVKLRGARTLLPVAALSFACAVPAFAADPCADYVPQPKPQNAGRDIVGQDIDQIRERGYMTFALYDDYPPYSFEEGGQIKGIDVEIAKLVAEFIGVDAQFKLVAAGENLEADLRNNIWKGPVVGGAVSNVMMRIPYDSSFKCRTEQVVYPGQYQEERIAIAYRESEYPEDKPVPAYFRFDTVAVENDSISDFYLTGFAGGQTAAGVRRYPSMKEAMEALNAGETMAAMGPLAQLEYFAGEGVGIHEPPLAGLAKSKWPLGMASHFAYRGLYYDIGDAISAGLSDGRIAQIFADFGLTHNPPQW